MNDAPTISQFATELDCLRAREAYCVEWMKGLEVTDEMLTAGAKMFEATLHSAADFKHHASQVFYAMLDAIPTKKIDKP